MCLDALGDAEEWEEVEVDMEAVEEDRSRVIRVNEGLAAFGRDEDRGGRGRGGRAWQGLVGEEWTEEGDEV